MRHSNETLALAGRMGQQRTGDMEKDRKRILEHPLKFDCIQGGKLFARDDSGRRVDLKVEIRDWKVTIGLRREDIEKMGPDFVEGERVPRETVYVTTDIYHAVRLVRHIQERHDAEMKGIVGLLCGVDLTHAHTIVEGREMDARQLEEVRLALIPPLEEVSEKKAVYKYLSSFKFDNALELLKKAEGESDQPVKRNLIYPACSTLVAFKNRYGRWRGRQVAKIDVYEQAREDGLRRVRNSRMRGLLIELADKFDKRDAIGVACTMAADYEMIERLGTAQEKIKKGKFEEALEIIKDCGTSVKAEWLKEKLRGIYRFVKRSMKAGQNGWRAEARGMLEDFSRYLGQRNTKYVAAELNETGDAGLEGFMGNLEAGNAKIDKSLEETAFWNKRKRLKEAAALFRKAVAALGKTDSGLDLPMAVQ